MGRSGGNWIHFVGKTGRRSFGRFTGCEKTVALGEMEVEVKVEVEVEV
jgi:hypothetical protein